MTREEEVRELERIAKEFPEEFGLRAFPGQRFRVNLRDCYISDGQSIIYVDNLWNGKWVSFAKDTAENLRKEVIA